MKIRATITAALAAATLPAASLIAASPAAADHHGHARAQAQPDVVQTARSTGVHNTLVAAVQAAGLVETLSGDGPFTVFAPTDTAFAKLPAGTVESLVQPANRGTLRTILTYHVVAGNISADDLGHLIQRHGGTATIETVAGETLSARLAGDTIIITDGAGYSTAVTQADVDVANGVIHVTDGVFLPG